MQYKTLLSTSLKGLLFMATGSALLLSSQTWAYDGTINVTGNIVDGSCDISTDTQTINVSLGSVQAASFANKGDVSNPVPFDILLKNCSSSVHEAQIMFIGKSVPNASQLLQLTQEAGVAENVGIRIRQPDWGDFTNYVSIPLNMKLVAESALEAGDNTLTYSLQYEATATPVTVGTGNAVMYFDLYYQ
jgi:major type 1 subunit fimbrin (pilin)